MAPLLACFVFLVFLGDLSTIAGGRPGHNKGDTPGLFLKAHNEARAEVGVEPLTWSAELSKDAELFARQHRRKKGCEYPSDVSGPYGENQAWSSDPITPTQVVALWVNAKQYYNHASNTCQEGNNCDIYTQVVWRNSSLLGCYQVQCGARKTSMLTICYYSPRGNVKGEIPY